MDGQGYNQAVKPINLMTAEYESPSTFELSEKDRYYRARFQYETNLALLGGVDGTQYNPTQLNLFLKSAKVLADREKDIPEKERVVSNPEHLENGLSGEESSSYYLTLWVIDGINKRNQHIQETVADLHTRYFTHPKQDVLVIFEKLTKAQREYNALLTALDRLDEFEAYKPIKSDLHEDAS